MNRISNPFSAFLNTADELPPDKMYAHLDKAVTDEDIQMTDAISRIIDMHRPFISMSTSM